MEFDDEHGGITSVMGDLWMNANKFIEDEVWEMLRLLMDEFLICSFIFEVLKADYRNSYKRRSALFNCLRELSIALRKLADELVGRAARIGSWRVKKAKKYSLLAMKFRDCMAHFRPIVIRGGLNEIIHLQFTIQWRHFDEWRKLLNPQFIDVTINFLFQKQECLSLNMKSCVEAIPEIILSRDSFLVKIIPPLIHENVECSSLLNLVTASLVQAVHSMYSWSMVDFLDQSSAEQEKLVNDLLMKLMPTTPATIDVFVNVLKPSMNFKSWDIKGAVSHFVHLLIPSGEEGKGQL